MWRRLRNLVIYRLEWEQYIFWKKTKTLCYAFFFWSISVMYFYTFYPSWCDSVCISLFVSLSLFFATLSMCHFSLPFSTLSCVLWHKANHIFLLSYLLFLLIPLPPFRFSSSLFFLFSLPTLLSNTLHLSLLLPLFLFLSLVLFSSPLLKQYFHLSPFLVSSDRMPKFFDYYASWADIQYLKHLSELSVLFEDNLILGSVCCSGSVVRLFFNKSSFYHKRQILESFLEINGGIFELPEDFSKFMRLCDWKLRGNVMARNANTKTRFLFKTLLLHDTLAWSHPLLIKPLV